MCLILCAYRVHPLYRLVLAANRDEFFERPTAAAGRWTDAPHVLGGRDLRSGGTWLGVTDTGRWAAVTNYRDPNDLDQQERSRGHLVRDYLVSDQDTPEYLRGVLAQSREFNGYNLLIGDADDAFWTSNRAPEDDQIRKLAPGVYGLSNHLLDTPWPKVQRGKAALAEVVQTHPDLSPRPLLDLLLDRTHAADHLLPSTGISTDLERALSATFVSIPGYGTRSSSALLIGHDGRGIMVERRFRQNGEPAAESLVEF